MQFGRLGWALLVAVGCGEPAPGPVGPSTVGSVSLKGQPVADVLVQAFRDEASLTPTSPPIAMGLTDVTGAFRLHEPGTSKGVSLSPGSYRFVLRSESPTPIPIGKRFTTPVETPLRQTIADGNERLTLTVE